MRWMIFLLLLLLCAAAGPAAGDDSKEKGECKLMKSADLSGKWYAFCFPAGTELPPLENFREIPRTLGGMRAKEFVLKDSCIDLTTLQRFREKQIFYLFHEFESPETFEYVAGAAADWWMRIVLNGECLADTLACGNVEPVYTPDEFPFRMPVKQGRNLLAAKVIAGAEGCRFVLGVPSRPVRLESVVEMTGLNFGTLRRELHGNGAPPPFSSRGHRDYTGMLKSMNFTATRTHDWALVNPGQRIIDTHFIFPLPHLSPHDPANYCFAPTDRILQQTLAMGTEVFYRLGTSIEHTGDIHFNANPPEDFEHYAEVLAGIIRHYTRGWANGFQYPIRYWEIWNEPDLRGKQCWTGSMESFAKFFVIVLKRLKAEFPELKIGGPAFSGFNEKHYRCVLDACKAAGVEPDFLSFHRYSAKLKQMKDIVENSGKLLQEYGFDRCEMILNEWHYIVDWNAARGTGEEYKNAVLSPSGLFGIDSAAFNVAVIALLHDTALDRAFYYGCDPFNIWGYYDIYRGLNKNYYSMVAVGDLMKNYRKRLHARAGVNVHLLGGISDDGRRAQLLAASYRTPETEIVLSLKNAGRYAMEAKILDHEHNFEPAKITVLNDRVILHKNRPGSAVFILDIRQL